MLRRIGADDLCHEDPVFFNGRLAFGQTGAAQSHLERNHVGVGDVFLFFGRAMGKIAIIGYSDTWKSMKCADWGAVPPRVTIPKDSCDIRIRSENNTLYLGSGAKSRSAHPCLRLTKPDSPVSVWSVPAWLKAAGFTYHSNPARWASNQELHVASRGQEFVLNIGDQAAPREWLRAVQAAIQQ